MALSSSASAINFAPQAFAIAVLHAARYPHADVTGFLLGKRQGTEVIVQKVVPFGHHWTELSPSEDNAIALLQAHLATSELESSSSSVGFALLGSYWAPSRASVTTPDSSALRLATKIASATQASCMADKGNASQSSTSFLAVLEATHILCSPSSLKAFVVTASPSGSSGNLPSLPISIQSEKATLEALKKGLRIQGTSAALWKYVVDFDDHLEDTTIDWLSNASAVSALSKIPALEA